ncbi:hypothetical protein NF556_09525 [Ornithinimicrobium faecis]|uniref:Nitrile hydratase alpha /Thiocyanate hydrolase gamma domain-containing protein n=1 Tax=Ornithinimicrobium faecis TaxID=2934158 RepID=A0ABY4YYM3_9MICO|nr:hypothetical protein [Ornithinimicrobium sp. HY1793]USQ81862.1 hypothetical protein NF556_09525 [Ornithinimicrobium sp. HY1793]
MALTEAQAAQFTDAYTNALITSWSDAEYAARLENDSRAALAEAGLELPAEAQIIMVRNPEPSQASDQQGSLEVQLGLYEQGLQTGRFEFHMPQTPQVDTSELDLGELAELAGGMYCCCCPCCCCG